MRKGPNARKGTYLIRHDRNGLRFSKIEKAMNDTIGFEWSRSVGGDFTRFEIVEVESVRNETLWRTYKLRREAVARENNGLPGERMLFHGSPHIDEIVQNGFDERKASTSGMFGAGLYFARNSAKSNQYVHGLNGGSGCRNHKDKSCYRCTRKLLLCRVILGKTSVENTPQKRAHAPPGFHSVMGKELPGFLKNREYVIYRGDQAIPSYIITYRLSKPRGTNLKPAKYEILKEIRDL